MRTYLNGRIFTGAQILDNQCVLTDDGKIVGIVERQNIPDTATVVDLQGHLLAPAFMDIQIYGGNGRLFGEFPSVEALATTYDYCRAGGAMHFLPTVATNSDAVVFAAIEAVREYWQQGGAGVIGLHLEGPYINITKRGAHLPQFVKNDPSVSDLEKWLSKGKNIVKMMTLAPELCSVAAVEYLQSNGVIVSAGHTNATFAEATAAFNGGDFEEKTQDFIHNPNKTIRVATHLFNAMSPFGHRDLGVVGAIFAHPSVRVSLVADGFHVDFEAIKIAKQLLGERLFLITDAVTENTEGLYSHRFDNGKYVVADGTLSGSALTMQQAVKNCVEEVGISLEESLRMASLYPAQVMGLAEQLGRIEAGFTEDFVLLDADLNVVSCF